MTSMPDPSGERLLRILDNLQRRTLAGALEWTRGSRADAFIYSGKNASVVLQTQDRDGLPPYEVDLIDGDGAVALTWTTELNSEHAVEQQIIDVLTPLYQRIAAQYGPAAGVLDALERDLLDEG